MVKKMRLLASACLFVRPSGCVPACISSAPTERIFVEFDNRLLLASVDTI
jgi:hypothetical protein